jgi:hypothetical protein
LTNSFDATNSIYAGAHYLSDLLKQFNGNMSYAAAGYNAGAGAVTKANGIPQNGQTPGYVSNVMGYFNSISGKTAATAQSAPTPTATATGTPTATPKAAASSGTSWITDGWNAIVTAATGSSLKPPTSAGTDTSAGGIPQTVKTTTSDASAWSQGLDNQAASALKAFVTGLLPSWLTWPNLGKYAMIAVLAIVGLLIFLEIFKPGMEQEAMKAAPYVK